MPATPADVAMSYIQAGAQPPPPNYKESLEKVKAADQIFSVRSTVNTIERDLLDTLMNELDNQREWAFGGHAVNRSWVDKGLLCVELDSGDIIELGFKGSENPWVTRSEKLKLLGELCKELNMAVISTTEQQMKHRWSVIAFTKPDDEEYEYTRHFDSMMRAYADGLHQLKHFGGKVALFDEDKEVSFEAEDVDVWRRIFELQGIDCRHQDFRECDDTCTGWFINEETSEVERCDNCQRFDNDGQAVAHVNGCVRELERTSRVLHKERWQVINDDAVQQFHRIEDAESYGYKAIAGGANILLKDLKLRQEFGVRHQRGSWIDLIADIKGQQWNDDRIQFPRLLTEILMAGELTSDGVDEFFSLKVKDICDSMDLTWEDITEIFNRAQDAYEDMK